MAVKKRSKKRVKPKVKGETRRLFEYREKPTKYPDKIDEFPERFPDDGGPEAGCDIPPQLNRVIGEIKIQGRTLVWQLNKCMETTNRIINVTRRMGNKTIGEFNPLQNTVADMPAMPYLPFCVEFLDQRLTLILARLKDIESVIGVDTPTTI